MKQPHKHAELIKAWADGAVIQHLAMNGLWYDVAEPSWVIDYSYRIKPKDVVLSGWIERTGVGSQFFAFNHPNDNIKLTFDGETGKLKSAEVLP
jgi:hypothetical protein